VGLLRRIDTGRVRHYYEKVEVTVLKPSLNKEIRRANVNKDDLSKAVYEVHGGMSFADAQKTVDTILETIKQRLTRGEKVLLSGFGCFRVVERKGRKGVNPHTGDPILIPGRRAVTFRASKML
jgi:DNA-binding protein HU-beta